jgi:hypothetical protein
MLPVAHHNVFYHEAAVHERDGGLDSEQWCTGNLYVFTKKGEYRTTPHVQRCRDFRKQLKMTHPRSGPTSLFAVVSKLLAAHPETYTTSSHRAICVICTGSTAPSVCTG